MIPKSFLVTTFNETVFVELEKAHIYFFQQIELDVNRMLKMPHEINCKKREWLIKCPASNGVIVVLKSQSQLLYLCLLKFLEHFRMNF